jgi:hypothetical protein
MTRHTGVQGTDSDAWRITEAHKQKLKDFFEDETVQSKIRAFPTPCQTESEKAVGIFD